MVSAVLRKYSLAKEGRRGQKCSFFLMVKETSKNAWFFFYFSTPPLPLPTKIKFYGLYLFVWVVPPHITRTQITQTLLIVSKRKTFLLNFSENYRFNEKNNNFYFFKTARKQICNMRFTFSDAELILPKHKQGVLLFIYK